MPFQRFGILGALAVLAVTAQVSRPASPPTKVDVPRHRHALARDVRVRPDGSVTSSNWSGYVVTAPVGSVTDAKASWTVPAVVCSGSSGNSYSAFWVGIDGYPHTAPTLEQIGTESDCEDGAPTYYAWYEFLPNQPNEQIIGKFPIHPGDKILAEVSFSGGQFTVTITDERTGRSVSTSQPPDFSGAMQSTVEWIAEAPAIGTVIQPIADFGTVVYGNDYTNVTNTCDATVGAQTGPIGSLPNSFPITMVNSDNGTIEAIPSPLSSDGSSFSVTWQGLTTLLSFVGTDGEDPSGLVQATNGDFYGTTQDGGANCTNPGCGTVFKIAPSGTLTTLYSFGSQSVDSEFPYAGLVQATNGDLYGTTFFDTIFKITPGGTLTTLYSFCSQSGCPDGESPRAALIQATNGDLYGTTAYGGANLCQFNGETIGCGTVFKITPSGKLTTLYSFGSQSGDGAIPSAALVQATNGDLYGTTAYGGANGAGTVFRITPSGKLTTLYSFCSQSGCTDGQTPAGGLIQATNGDLYGTTYGAFGGPYGTVFKITLSGRLTTLYSFCPQSGCTDGANPLAGLVQATDGDFYGTTAYGGAGYYGTVFKISPSGTLTTLYSFCSQTGCPDGIVPYAGLAQATNGALYGTTAYGGANANGGDGTVFSLSVGLGPFVEMQPTSGKVGATVKILGTNLTGATSVSFNGTAAAFTVNSSGSAISTTVPAGASSGKVQVVTPIGTLSSNVPFRVP